MFSFLNPAILMALFAGLIPIIIHFFNKRKQKIIPFSTIHFLKEMHRKEMRRLKIRQIILLILRTLIILLLVLAFARPTYRANEGLAEGRSAVDAYFIIDNSMSLNRLNLNGNLLDEIRKHWHQAETLFKNGDRITAILATNPLKILTSRENYSGEVWQKISRQIQTSALEGQIHSAVLKTLEIMAENKAAANEIYILSDFQSSGFSREMMPALTDQMPENCRIIALPVSSDEVENVSIDTVYIQNQLLVKEQPVKISATAKNQFTKGNLTSLVSLMFRDERSGQQNIDIAAKSEADLQFENRLKHSGFVGGYVESEADALMEDNRYYFNFYLPQQVNVLLLSKQQDDYSPVAAILQPAVEKGIFNLSRISLSRWSAHNFNLYDLIILDGLDHLAGGLAGRLKQLSAQGKGIIMLPGKNLDLKSANRFLSALNAGKFVEKIRGDNTEDFLSLKSVNRQHPIFDNLLLKKDRLPPVQVRQYYRFMPAPGDIRLMNLSNQQPLLLSSNQPSGAFFIFSSSLDNDWSNLGNRGMVIPLFYRMIYYAAIQAVSERNNIQCGQVFRHVLKQIPQSYNFELVKPDKSVEKLSPKYQGRKVVFEIAGNEIPGNYKIQENGNTVLIYSVNHPTPESENAYLNEAEFKDYFPRAMWMASGDNLFENIQNSRSGVELWVYLMALVLFLLLIEMFISFTGSQKEAKRIREREAVA